MRISASLDNTSKQYSTGNLGIGPVYVDYTDFLGYVTKIPVKLLQPGEMYLAHNHKYIYPNVRYYTLYLVKCKSGDYRAVFYMHLRFLFINDQSENQWTWGEKYSYIYTFKKQQEQRFGDWVLKVLPNGKTIKMNILLECRKDSLIPSHWDIAVSRNCAPRSQVIGQASAVRLDSEDLDFIKYIEGNSYYYHPVATHEFGHMLGLHDEYHKKSPFYNDTDSLMNGGSIIQQRHIDQIFEENKKLFKIIL